MSYPAINIDVNHNPTPLLTQGKLSQNRYKPTSVRRMITHTKTENKPVQMNVRDAREKGYGEQIGDGVADTDYVIIQVPEKFVYKEIETATIISDLKHRHRSARCNEIRPEYLDASRQPTGYLHPWIRKHYETDIEHYKFTNVGEIQFFVIVRLGLVETPSNGKAWTTTPLECYYVTSCEGYDCTVVNREGEKMIITMTEAVQNSCMIRDFILFLHADCVVEDFVAVE